MLRRVLTTGMLLLLVAASALPTHVRAAEVGDVARAFAVQSAAVAWPVANGSAGDASTGATNVMEITTHAGDDVVAVADGALWQVVATRMGDTVVLRHTFTTRTTFEGKDVQYYYTWYRGLADVDDALVRAAAHGVHPALHAGEHMGTAGEGTVAFEVRVGTSCSLAYQHAHPDAACAAFGFDPHVHPMTLFGAEPSTAVDALVAVGTAHHADTIAVFDVLQSEQRDGVAAPSALPLAHAVRPPAPVRPVVYTTPPPTGTRVTEREVWGRGITTVW